MKVDPLVNTEYFSSPHDEVCGRHSGIPECCIKYYMDVWINQSVWRTEAGQISQEPHVGYIACPKCRAAKSFVSITDCPDKHECLRQQLMCNQRLDFVPPWKPVPLLQEYYFPDRWAMMVCCIFLNRAKRQQVDKVVEHFFDEVWGAENYVETYESEHGKADIINIIRPLGFYNRRAERIYKFSKAVIEKGWSDYRKLPGIGQYSARCYEMLYLGHFGDTPPEDHALADYWNFYMNECGKKVK